MMMMEYGDEFDCLAMTYADVEAAGLPARPLEFPNPTVHRGKRTSTKALDHRTGRVHAVNNVLIKTTPAGLAASGNAHQPADAHLSAHLPQQQQQQQSQQEPEKAYLIKKKLCRSIYGVVRLCVVLRRRPRLSGSSHRRGAIERQFNRSADDVLFSRSRTAPPLEEEDVEWVSTEELCVVKVSSWNRMHQLRGRHLEDPIKEISAMQLVGNYHANVVGCTEVLQDDDYLYTIMPYCAGGDLFGRIMGNDKTRSDSNKSDKTFDQAGIQIEEDRARVWFQQLLAGLFHLQRKGVCHRDLSLENIMIDEEDGERLKIIDFGMSLRVPYVDLTNPGSDNNTTDVSDGTDRLLIKSQGQGGKLMYMAPEVVAREEAFDGFAVDLWAAGVILFVMLVGLAPFKWAHPSDRRYAKIAKGNLKDLLEGLDIVLSEEAVDLLQQMFYADPRKRLSLSQIMLHPWVQGHRFSSTPSSPSKAGTSEKGSRSNSPNNHHNGGVAGFIPIWKRGVAHVQRVVEGS